MCLKGFCSQCSGLQKLSRFLHLHSTHEIGKTLVSLGKYKSVIYGVKDQKELKRCELVKSDVCVADFMKLFQEKIVYDYIGNTHRTRWLDEHFKFCKDTFPLGMIVLVVDFTEKYTLETQNEVQPMYYNSIQVSIFLHNIYSCTR